jgi:ribonuclease D
VAMCRPLSEGALTYARTDVHYLLHIAAVLVQRLRALDVLQEVCAEPMTASCKSHADLSSAQPELVTCPDT